MWFKQFQIFTLSKTVDLSIENLQEKLGLLAYKPCLPSMPLSYGWISPIEREEVAAPLLRVIHDRIILCLSIEEKLLPTSVINPILQQKIKKIEMDEDRRVRTREKLSLKDELTVGLLPRAFSRFSKVYGYIDLKTRRLYLGTLQAKSAKLFLSLLTKVLGEEINALDLAKISPLMTQWVKQQEYPSSFAIEKACVLQDPMHEKRIIRCQDQDLFSASIKDLIKDGCEIKQLALNWQDRVEFVLGDDFSFKNLRYEDQVIVQTKEMDPETEDQQFDADFFIMVHELEKMVEDLLIAFKFNEKEEIAA
jgi:recombination associated protein RdgC